MHEQHDHLFSGILLLLAPLLLALPGLLPSKFLNRNPRFFARLSTWLGLGSFALTIIAIIRLMRMGPLASCVGNLGPFAISFYFDNLSAIILGLIAFLVIVITHYAATYMEGDPEQGRFTKWLCLTSASVMLIVISGNLVLFALAWSSTSLCLHHLLTFYGDRPGALQAARKKFLFSRIGDACLLGVIILTSLRFHTWDFQELFAAAHALHAKNLMTGDWMVTSICFLLVGTAVLKSAQFPFHCWLPDTMETPTPVSALMHAGVINAGGFLIVRMSPLVSLSPEALALLTVLGGFTALFASLTMLTHASIKRALAFSTVAQMGFMMLECGLGAFSLAVLHLTAHSLYKAHAFLSTGDLTAMGRSRWIPTGRTHVHPWIFALTIATSVLLALSMVRAFGLVPTQNPRDFILISILVISLTYLLWSYWNKGLNASVVLIGLIAGLGLSAVYLALHGIFYRLLSASSPETISEWSVTQAMPVLILLVLFGGVLLLQIQLPQWEKTPFCRSLYVHARNGFYFSTFANRLVSMLWGSGNHQRTNTP